MVQSDKYEAIIIGGSAGSFQVITKILESLPSAFNLPVFLCFHRLKYVRSGFLEILSTKTDMPIVEPNDKEYINPGIIYLAPSNYHMYVEMQNHIALSTEEPVNQSRPSIDLSFFSAASSYKNKLIGIILSGANKDGALGLKRIKDSGGITIVQHPDECQVNTMTLESLKQTQVDYIYTTEQIIEFLRNLL